jgi:hypothetical protein
MILRRRDHKCSTLLLASNSSDMGIGFWENDVKEEGKKQRKGGAEIY